MPAQPRSATSESLLPSVDYPSGPARPFRPGPDLKLIAAPAAPPTRESDVIVPAGAPPAQTAVADQAPADDRRLAALRSLTEEEIVALFG
ncbi:MAG TPA: hypothetical protein VNL39_10080 [Xanthobacteraceae bacterium]|nr:hypothetical protein [Xanthobacteraceae bacterium]